MKSVIINGNEHATYKAHRVRKVSVVQVPPYRITRIIVSYGRARPITWRRNDMPIGEAFYFRYRRKLMNNKAAFFSPSSPIHKANLRRVSRTDGISRESTTCCCIRVRIFHRIEKTTRMVEIFSQPRSNFNNSRAK